MRTVFFLLLVGIALGLRLNSDSYITLPQDGYLFTCTPAGREYHISIGQLPTGLALNGNRLIAVQGVQAGQYILSVVATDDGGNRDEQIIIVNVDGSVRPTVMRGSATSSGRSMSSSSSSVTVGSPSAAAVANAASSSQVTELREVFGQPSTNSGSSASSTGSTTTTTSTTTTQTSGTASPPPASLDIDALQQLFSSDTSANFGSSSTSSTSFTSTTSSSPTFTTPSSPGPSTSSPTDLASILSDYSSTTTSTPLDFSSFESPDVGNP